MRSVLMMIVLSVTLLAGCSSMTSDDVASYELQSSGIRKVAIIDVQGAIKGEFVKNSVCSYFNMELLRRGYQVVERQQIEALLREIDFQSSGVTSEYQAARIGNMCNVEGVLLVNIPEYGEKVSMTAKLIR